MTCWFWLDLPDLRGAPCGAVACSEQGRIQGGAPLFVARFGGWPLNAVIRRERSQGRRAHWQAL